MYFTAEESPTRSPSHDSSLKAMAVIELECPICLNMMVGQYHQPFFCSNGHPCCTYCTTRVTGCPSCRSSGPWGRCLVVERIGSWMLQRGIVDEPSPPPPLPSTPMRDWQSLLASPTVPRNNVGRVQLFRSEGRTVGYPDRDENIPFSQNIFQERRSWDLHSESEASSSPTDVSPILYHNPAILQSLRRLASPEMRLTSSPPFDLPVPLSVSSTPLSAIGSLWLGSSNPSSLTPTPRDSPEEGMERWTNWVLWISELMKLLTILWYSMN